MKTLNRIAFLTALCCLMQWGEQAQAADTINYVGYPNCIELRNETTRVILCPEAGGRVLVYALAGASALYLEEEETGQDYVPGERATMSAGRFDIGPEKIIPRRELLWSGKWIPMPVGSAT